MHAIQQMTRLEKIQIALIAVGIALILLGTNWDVPSMIDVGLLSAGAGVISSGVETLATMRVGFWSRISQDLYGGGTRAFVTGLLLTAVGIWIWVLASVRLLGITSQAKAYLSSYPGVILLNASIFLFLFSAFGFLRLEGWRASIGNALRAAPILLISGFLLFAALFTLVIGLYALIAPLAFQERIASFLHPAILPP